LFNAKNSILYILRGGKVLLLRMYLANVHDFLDQRSVDMVINSLVKYTMSTSTQVESTDDQVCKQQQVEVFVISILFL